MLTVWRQYDEAEFVLVYIESLQGFSLWIDDSVKIMQLLNASLFSTKFDRWLDAHTAEVTYQHMERRLLLDEANKQPVHCVAEILLMKDRL